MASAFRILIIAGTVLAAAVAPASAQERRVSEGCNAAMSRDWPKVVGSQDQASRTAALPLISKLRMSCAKDGEALDDLALAEAVDQFYLDNPSAAIAALDTHKPAPQSADYALSEWLYLSATQATGDAARFVKERDAFLAAHDAALVSRYGAIKREVFETPYAKVNAYQTKNERAPFIFVANPKDDGEPVSLIAEFEFPLHEKAYYSYRAYACWLSSPEGGGELPAGKLPDYADAKAVAVKAFSEKPPAHNDNFDTPLFAPFASSPSRMQPCSNAGHILPAFADAMPLTGGEYTARGAPLSEEQLSKMLQGSIDQKSRAITYIQQHPDSIPPFGYVYMIGDLMERGDLEQAAFWYYVYQIRIQPWKTPRSEPSADYANEIYGALSETLGRPINEWAGSDFEGFRDLMLRASSYERKMPLYPGRPDGVEVAEWQKRIAESRASHDAATLDKYFPDTPAARADNESKRKANGLYVGPWKSPGAPLPDDWR